MINGTKLNELPFACDRERQCAYAAIEDFAMGPIAVEVETVGDCDLDLIIPGAEQVRVEIEPNRDVLVNVTKIPFFDLTARLPKDIEAVRTRELQPNVRALHETLDPHVDFDGKWLALANGEHVL